VIGAEVVSVLRPQAHYHERSRLRSVGDGAMSPSDSCVAVLEATGRIGHNFGQLTMHGGPARRPPALRAGQVTHTHTADLAVQRNCACECGTSSPSGGCKDCHPEKLGLQPKLRVGARSDVREQEADRIAEQVMRMPGPAHVGDSALPEGGPLVQRRLSGDTPEQTEVTPIVHEVLASSGHPLDAAARAFFEPRFGLDFSRVRLHTDARAKESVNSVDALAYTVGQHVVLGRSVPPLHSSQGTLVLAHELTHAIQQDAGATNRQPLGSGALARFPAPASPDSGPTGVPTLAFDPAAIPAFPWDLDPDVDLESTTMRNLYVFSLQQAWISLTSDPDTAYRLLASMRDTVMDTRPLIACVDARDDESVSIGLDKLLVELQGILELLELDTDVCHDELRTWFEGAVSWMTELDPALASVEQLGSVGSCGVVVLIPLIEGLDESFKELDDDELQQFWGRLKANALFSAVFPQAFMVGTVVGIGKEAKAAVEQVVAALTDPAAAATAVKESIQGFTDLVSELFSLTGAGLAREIGRSAVALLGTEIINLNDQPGPPQFAYALGEKLGPQIVYAVLSLLGFEVFVAGRALLLAKKGLDGLRDMKAFSRIAGLLRRVPDVDLPTSSSPLPRGGASPSAGMTGAVEDIGGGVPSVVVGGRRFWAQRTLRNALGEDHTITILPDGRIMRCSSPVCDVIAANLRARRAALPAQLPPDVVQEVGLLVKQAEQLQRRASDIAKSTSDDARRIKDLDEKARQAIEIEQRMSQIEYNAGVTGVRLAPPFTRTPQALDDLARDPGQGFAISPRSIHDRDIGLDLEIRGELEGPIRRDPDRQGGEFLDVNNVRWDIKSPNSQTFVLEEEIRKIGGELTHENIIVELANLTPAEAVALRAEVALQTTWKGRVILWP